MKTRLNDSVRAVIRSAGGVHWESRLVAEGVRKAGGRYNELFVRRLVEHPVVTREVLTGTKIPGAIRVDSTKTAGRVQELCKSRGGRPGLSVLMSLTVSVDVKQH